ncbi:MAG: hypothetical protein ACRDNZ_10695, partial [Streptosporangiaceae bacterium]
DQATDRAFGSDARRDRSTQAIRPDRLADAQAIADRLTATGKRVSRRSLRGAGLHGSNAELGAVARMVGSQLAHEAARAGHG